MSKQEDWVSLRHSEPWRGDGAAGAPTGSKHAGQVPTCTRADCPVPATEYGIRQVTFVQGWLGQAKPCEHSARVHFLLGHKHHLSPGAATRPPRSLDVPLSSVPLTAEICTNSGREPGWTSCIREMALLSSPSMEMVGHVTASPLGQVEAQRPHTSSHTARPCMGEGQRGRCPSVRPP